MVKVIGVDLDKRGLGFCGSQQFARIMTERIPHKLLKIEKLHEREQLTVLYNALKGYNAICKKYGPVKVTPEQIGFN